LTLSEKKIGKVPAPSTVSPPIHKRTVNCQGRKSSDGADEPLWVTVWRNHAAKLIDKVPYRGSWTVPPSARPHCSI